MKNLATVIVALGSVALVASPAPAQSALDVPMGHVGIEPLPAEQPEQLSGKETNNCSPKCKSNEKCCVYNATGDGDCRDVVSSKHDCGSCGNYCQGKWDSTDAKCVNGKCFDVGSDAANCGALGKVCPNGSPCCKGECCGVGNACNTVQTRGGNCIDLQSDDKNCGKANNECRDNHVCKKGSCVCNPSEVECAGECVTTKAHPDHCGKCGNVCAPGRFCNGGKCLACGGGKIACDRYECTSTRTDESNCGKCSHECPGGWTCINGLCRP